MKPLDKAIFDPEPAMPVEEFQSHLQSVCGLFDVEPADRTGTVSGHAGIRPMGRFDVAEVRLNALNVSRGATNISRDPGSHYFAILQFEGQCLIKQADKASLLSPGEVCIVDSSLPSEFVYNGCRSHQVSFHLPRDEMVGRFGSSFDSWCHLPEAKSWFPPILAVARKLLEARSRSASQQLEESLLSLIGAALTDLQGGETDLQRRVCDLIERAVLVMEENCTDPDYSPARLADDLGVSSRTLQRHFQSLGETPGRRLLDARLSHAYRTLVSPDARRVATVTDVAFEAGFSDLSHFHRAFRAKYGLTPGELKSRH
ncbi:MAG: helix-turn-helix domain-containing protein [Pseudomonadota bacterium]